MNFDNQNTAIVLFDGVCNLCNKTVQLIIQKDKNNYFRFASLQSNFGKEMIEKYGIDVDSIVFIEHNKAYSQSTAALKIAKRLGGIYKFLSWAIIIPKSIRDRMYKWIAKNRYKWFGIQNSCWIPNAELNKKFIA